MFERRTSCLEEMGLALLGLEIWTETFNRRRDEENFVFQQPAFKNNTPGVAKHMAQLWRDCGNGRKFIASNYSQFRREL